jgi:hypothetical protein
MCNSESVLFLSWLGRCTYLVKLGLRLQKPHQIEQNQEKVRSGCQMRLLCLNSADLITISKLIETGNSLYLQRWKLALCSRLLSLELSLA